MAIVKNSITHKITNILVGDNHLIRAFLTPDGQIGDWYPVQCTGSGNYQADAYAAILTLPQWSGALLDASDIALEFPGSGGAYNYTPPVDLAAEKIKAKDGITLARNAEEFAGFMAYGKEFDSDSDSQRRILIAANTAQVVGEAFSIDWTCADNSVITLDYAQMLGLPAIMAQYGDTLHQKARTLKAQIDAATTLEEINAVVW